jgi:hypothetical protein
MKRSLAVGVIWSLAIFVVVNCINLLSRPACFDCSYRRGTPFPLYFDPTFTSFDGKGSIVWTGLVADSTFAVLSGILLGLLIHATRPARD